MRVLGVDYGTKNIGVAVSDELGLGARGVTTLRRLSDGDAVARIVSLAAELEVAAVVVGVPLAADHTEGDAARRVLKFVDRLKNAAMVPVHTIGERLTSVEAEERLRELGIRGEERKRRVDEVAATIIVEEFLSARGRAGASW